MKDILLITYKNSLYRERLVNKGFSVEEFAQPISEDAIAPYFDNENYNNYIAVIELIDENIDRISGVIELLFKHSPLIVSVTGKITDKIKTFLFRYGIPDILELDDPQRLIDYLPIIGEHSERSTGKIIILDDVKPQVSILKTIVNRFSYRPVFVNSQNELFDGLKQSNIQLLLLNLGTNNFDINSFVKRSFSDSEIKNIPLIAYKQFEEGLLVNEIISGLNRLTKVILSPDELFSFLLNLLFRREIYNRTKSLNASIRSDDTTQYSEGSLSQAFKIAGADIYSIKNIIMDDNYSKLVSISNSINKTLLKVEGLKWIIKDDISAPTCGVGV